MNILINMYTGSGINVYLSTYNNFRTHYGDGNDIRAQKHNVKSGHFFAWSSLKRFTEWYTTLQRNDLFCSVLIFI